MSCPISALSVLVQLAFDVYSNAEAAAQNNKECISLSKNLEKLCSILKYIQEDVSKANNIDILSDCIMGLQETVQTASKIINKIQKNAKKIMHKLSLIATSDSITIKINSVNQQLSTGLQLLNVALTAISSKKIDSHNANDMDMMQQLKEEMKGLRAQLTALSTSHTAAEALEGSDTPSSAAAPQVLHQKDSIGSSGNPATISANNQNLANPKQDSPNIVALTEPLTAKASGDILDCPRHPSLLVRKDNEGSTTAFPFSPGWHSSSAPTSANMSNDHSGPAPPAPLLDNKGSHPSFNTGENLQHIWPPSPTSHSSQPPGALGISTQYPPPYQQLPLPASAPSGYNNVPLQQQSPSGGYYPSAYPTPTLMDVAQPSPPLHQSSFVGSYPATSQDLYAYSYGAEYQQHYNQAVQPLPSADIYQPTPYAYPPAPMFPDPPPLTSYDMYSAPGFNNGGTPTQPVGYPPYGSGGYPPYDSGGYPKPYDSGGVQEGFPYPPDANY
ncbi:hypothetical protein CEUSTIGMA_g2703.t1 [Chlamydomonas eustigma]|uniref:Uncharacterized protein n=1 Tax=Chlamydomonas eustigma TaxID=1157962 RepID=A0A250WWP5_9CHLO|nr:hypothetical protein CEUSTIGMA_g2703.t1 [Chlamydomonas eustigma]|eukprot:GAX75258.1 hypothetical protein CEUSTIGMA_g2703.t1 [Chlamydomonas eustigma]